MDYMKVDVKIYSKDYEGIAETIHIIVPMNDGNSDYYFDNIEKILADKMYKDEWISRNVEKHFTFTPMPYIEFKAYELSCRFNTEKPFTAIILDGAGDNYYLQKSLCEAVEQVSKSIIAHKRGETVGV